MRRRIVFGRILVAAVAAGGLTSPVGAGDLSAQDTVRARGGLSARDAADGPCAGRIARLAAGEDDAPAGPFDRPVSDLYCFSLLPTAAGGDAAGLVELVPVPSPFGVAVTPDGHQLRELVARIDGLPDPASLGPYTTFVAWATPPELDPVVRLGEVADGRVPLGRVAFDKYLLWISAEASAEPATRDGPLVLRGRSPSSLMESHDLLAQAPSAVQRGEGDPTGRWAMPPMYPGIPMLPGLMSLEPAGSPLTLAADPASLPAVRPSTVVELPDGGTLDLEAGLVRRTLAGRDIAMLAFNGMHPGPMIRVREASTIFVNFTNRTPYPTAVHWHGIRLDNPFDGVPGVTQDPVAPGETFRYRIRFDDPGIYWYHPHHREDVQQELGLYGNLLVDAPDPDYYGAANRDVALMLDDILLGGDGIVPFGETSANYMLMGRFGNTMLVNGDPEYELAVDRGEVVRFHLTNASNTRTFNVSFVPEARFDELAALARDADPNAARGRLPLKVVASDVGRFEREVRVHSAVLGPAERYVVEARFPGPGRYALVNHVHGINHRQGVFRPELARLGTVTVSGRPASPDHAAAFERLRTNADVIRELDAYRSHAGRAADRELVMTLEVDSLPRPIERSMAYDWVYFNPVEWTGTMPMMNWVTTGREVRWVLRDPASGAENLDIDWSFRVGDVVKIRVRNDRSAFHAMQHPLHIHGQRFLVLSQDGRPNDNLVWKDTALLPAGSTTDLLLEVSNPGRWMVHCHIAEHLESGMRLVMSVAAAEDR